jgi:soluble lytic murein transglycosylase-like protein
MRLGQLLSDTGYGMEIAQKIAGQARTERQNQLAIEEQNRQQAYQAQVSQELAAQQFGGQPFMAQMTPGLQFGQPPAANEGLGLRPMTPAEVARLQQDPYATRTGQPPAVPVPPAPAGGGRGFVNPPLVGQPQPGTVALTPGVGLTLGAEQLGQQFETARNDYRAAVAKLQTYGLRQRQADPSGYEAARLAEAQTKQRLDAAQKTYETAAEPFTRSVQTDPNFLGQRAAASASARAGLAIPAAPATPTEPTAPAQPTKAAQSYDSKVTPYDALMAQSAAQYGIDPVVFKRLIGTESSFRPDPGVVIGANGQRHIGIAQISDRHGLSDADRRNPAIAIPFAAQLLAKEIQKTGGNVEEALMNYKGASSPEGRAAMSKPIGDILSGLTPSATPTAPTAPAAPEAFKPAVTPAKTADAVVKAATYGTMYGSATGDASANNPQIQQVLTERQALVRQIQLMAQYGFGERAMQLVPQVRAIDLGLLKAQADQGIYEGTTTGNFSRAMAVLSNFRGQPHQSLDRGDGTHDLYVGGKLARVGMTAEAMGDFLNSNIDPAYRERKAALVVKGAERQAKIEEIVAKEVANAAGNMQVAMINAQAKLMEAGITKQRGDTKLGPNGEIVVSEDTPRGRIVTYIDPKGNVQTIRGKEQVIPSTTQIYGPR